MISRDELPRVLWSAGYFFFVLSSYFILRPVREALGIDRGSEWLDELYLRTFLTMLVAAPIFALMVTRLAKRTFLPLVYHMATIMLLVFAGLFAWYPQWTREHTGPIFFNWLSVYNLFAVSVFWSVVSNVFTVEQGKRVFAVIAVGGTLGALAGSWLTTQFAEQLSPSVLIVISVGLLQAGVVCLWRLIRFSGASADSPLQGADRVGGTTWSGLVELLRSPYLMGIAGYILLATVTATIIYFAQSMIVEEVATDRAERTALFAKINLWSQGAILLVQLFVTSHALRRLGIGITLGVLPIFYVVGFGVLGLFPAFATIAIFEVSRKALLHGVAKPTKELLFTLVSDDARYKSKNVMDTVVYRGGDLIGAQVMGRLRDEGFSLSRVAFSMIPLCAVWLVLCLGLGRASARQQGGAREVPNA